MSDFKDWVPADPSVRIGELAKLSGVRQSTLKFYTEQGILPFNQQDARLSRRYDTKASLARLKEIQGMKIKGYPIGQIKEELKRKIRSFAE